MIRPLALPAFILGVAAMSLAQSPPVSEVPPPGGAAPAHTNRLAKQSSPYLLQHAHNPVDWWPWGEEAFAEAKRRNVPIFLSVGYSTCYWCHVMERECFENEAIAKLLNENFVCIKVDREERPDVDDIYMTAVQLMTHRGGWPMTVWLTPPGARNETDPGLEPFYAGTYFPPESKYGVPGLPDVVGSVAEAWKSQHQQVLDQAAQVAGALREHAAHETTTVRLGHLEIGKAANALLNIHDTKEGGFGNPPKFPQPVFLEFLLELDGRINEPAVSGAITSAIRLTLDKMALGGMYDQVGGGFHRYSTDAKWLVPHFEKMLYDNAQLAAVYARSYAMRRDPFDARILSETLDYVLKEMLDKETGAFHSAQDAEVDEREGLNYLWTKQQIMETLGEADGKLACTIYGLDQGTNFKDPHHPEDGYKNVLFMEKRPEAFAAELKMTPDALRAAGERIDAKLYDARRTRKQPSTDDKVITSWNGLMIAALADGSLVLGQPKYLDAAERASRFFLVNMRTRTGGVFRTYRDTKAKTAGFLEDFSFLIKGLLAVHRAEAAYARADLRYLKGAEELTRVALERFGSESTPGALFDTRDAQPDLIVRSRSLTDGALPSGQSVMIHNLLDLYEITRDKTYLDRAVALIGSMSPEIAASPLSTVNATRAIMRLLGLAPQRLAELGPDRSNEAGEGPTVDADSPVKVHASTDRIAVPSGKEGATLHLRLEIEPGHHINAHEPGVPGMTGLDIRIEGGTGVKLAANWPKAEAYKGHALPEGEGPLMVHAGEVEFDVVLSRTEDAWSGRPLVVVTYQVCTDRECLAPTTVSLDVALDPG